MTTSCMDMDTEISNLMAISMTMCKYYAVGEMICLGHPVDLLMYIVDRIVTVNQYVIHLL